MGLTSTILGFKGDTALEDCLVRDSAHILQGASGNHVAKIQQALIMLDGLDILAGEITSKRYGTSTAAAVLQFKRKRTILNFRNQLDDIVGRKTIKRLDDELAKRPSIDPGEIVVPPDVPFPPTPPPSPTSTFFKIRFLGGFGAGAGLAGDLIFLQIVDITNALAQVFTYTGGGLGVGIKKLPPLAATTAGPFRTFTTPSAVPVGIFAGPARWTAAGVGPLSVNILHIPFIAGTTFGVQMFVDTGFTVGIGASSTVGFVAPSSNAGPFTG